jgi:hypothetical protein
MALEAPFDARGEKQKFRAPFRRKKEAAKNKKTRGFGFLFFDKAAFSSPDVGRGLFFLMKIVYSLGMRQETQTSSQETIGSSDPRNTRLSAFEVFFGGMTPENRAF